MNTKDIILLVAAIVAICVFMVSMGVCHVIGYRYMQKRKLIIDVVNASGKFIESINKKKNQE